MTFISFDSFIISMVLSPLCSWENKYRLKFSRCLYLFSRDVIIKYHTGCLHEHKAISLSSAGLKSKVLAGWVSPEIFLLVLQMATFSPKYDFSLSYTFSSLSHCVLISYSSKDTSQIGAEHVLKPYFNIITSLKVLYLNIMTFWDIQGKFKYDETPFNHLRYKVLEPFLIPSEAIHLHKQVFFTSQLLLIVFL
jgi:hypothetical protein